MKFCCSDYNSLAFNFPVLEMVGLLFYVLLVTISTMLGKSKAEKCNCINNPIDLGFGVDENSLPIPSFSPFRYTKRATGHWGGKNGPWYNYNEFSSSEYVSTSVTTGSLLLEGATTVGNLPLSRLITKAIIVDVSKDVGDNWNYTLPASKLDEWVATNGEIPYNCFLIIKFGWSSRYPNKLRYFGPSDTDFRWPGISIEAAQWILNTGKITGIGFDTVTATPGRQLLSSALNDFMSLRNNIFEISKLNLVEYLPPRFNIIIMPMKLTESPGAPTRIIAYV